MSNVGTFERALGSDPLVATNTIELLWVGIDHAEGLAFAADGTLWAGGEEGQIYMGALDEEPAVVGKTPGRTLGFAVDGSGRAYCADMTAPGVYRIDPSGSVSCLSAGSPARAMRVPNALAFTPDGLLLATDSGDWDTPNGCIYAIAGDGETREVSADAARFPNGIAVSPDGGTVAVIESTLPGVSLLSLEDGVLTDYRVLLEMPSTIPDGVAWDSDNRLLISCWSPDAVFLADLDGECVLLAHDPLRFSLNQPTNVAFLPGTNRVIAANIGERFVSAFEHDSPGGTVHRPVFDE
ncbi:MAG TPA: SMP-30/gluconolactonase/LRE family protein [Gaiellaceae bacterium]|nr:SMP-30/gluconolactonase/LRE family protein [Gaiellaceae bacterium]